MKKTEREALFNTLQVRFEENPERHKGINWSEVLDRLEACSSAKLRSLNEMEATGGEPDVIGRDKNTGEFLFVDCSAQSPAGRRSLCYDHAALESRKANKPANSAMDMATAMGVEILTEDEYRHLQSLGSFDTKTSSWVKTPEAIRKLGGALFCDRRYDHVFVYHNGAESYYVARGFRAALKI